MRTILKVLVAFVTVTLVSAAGRVADHSSLRPWRIIELRGDARLALGAASAAAQGDSSPSTKPLRAPLLGIAAFWVPWMVSASWSRPASTC